MDRGPNPTMLLARCQMTDALCVNDCKSLGDVLLAAGSAASKTSEDKRLGIEFSMIKQRLSRNETRFQWVEGAMTSSRTQVAATSRTPRSRRLTTMRSISEFVSIDFWACEDAA